MNPDRDPPHFTESYHEYIHNDIDIAVCGRLKTCVNYYQQTGANQFVLSVIRHEYTIPFSTEPTPVFLKNNKTARENPEFVRNTIDDLLQAGVIAQRSQPAFVNNPLSVSSKNDKLRMVLDCRHINSFIDTPPVKLENHDTFIKTLMPGDWMISFDLKSGYHHVAMSQNQSEFLGFAYPDINGVLRFFHFLSMPFGLAPATLVFTKLLRHFVERWRSQAISSTIFVDDGIANNASDKLLTRHADIIKNDLLSGGWVPHKTKCIWVPVRQMRWLGAGYDTIQNLVTAPDDKVSHAVESIDHILHNDRVHVKALARAVGRIVSIHMAFGDLVYAKTKQSHMQISTCPTWDENITPSSNTRLELEFWKKFFYMANGQDIFTPASAIEVKFTPKRSTIQADISLPYTVPPLHRSIKRKLLPQHNLMTNEFLFMIDIINNLGSWAAHRIVQWKTVHTVIVFIARKGSMDPKQADLVFRLLRALNINKITISTVWMPQASDICSEMQKNIIDNDDWRVSSQYFKIIPQRTICPSIDRFADEYNSQVTRFNSRLHTPNCEAVYAFSQNWSSDINWAVPPIHLISRTLFTIAEQKAHTIFVVPVWKAHYFWPILMKFIESQKTHIQDRFILPNIFQAGRCKQTAFGKQQWPGLILWINYL